MTFRHHKTFQNIRKVLNTSFHFTPTLYRPLNNTIFQQLEGWPSGLRRQTQVLLAQAARVRISLPSLSFFFYFFRRLNAQDWRTYLLHQNKRTKQYGNSNNMCYINRTRQHNTLTHSLVGYYIFHSTRNIPIRINDLI